MDTAPKNPNWLGFFLIIVFLAVASFLLIYLLFLNKQNPEKQTEQKKEAAVQTTNISITKDGFSPLVIRIKKGTAVTWTNKDNSLHQIASDPYPKNDQLPSLSETDPLAFGEILSFNFDKSGTFTYHDQYNPLKFKGTIIVE